MSTGRIAFQGEPPVVIGSYANPLGQYMFFQDMLVCMPSGHLRLPHPLEPLSVMVSRCYEWCRPRVAGLSDMYCYVSAKRQPLGAHASFSRPGWHIDGFLSRDETFVYSDIFPTEFSRSTFDLTPDHVVSLREMESQAHESDVGTMAECALSHLSPTCVHRVHIPEVPHTRTFIKIVLSYRQFNLQGNAINPLLPVPWTMHPRKVGANRDSLSRNGDRYDPAA